MSVYDYITPSEQAAELGLLVNRMRRRTKRDEVPVLVVEGANDRSLFKPHCGGDLGAVFPAGTRQLVEQLLSHLDAQPVAGCKCVFLVDCDGVGKTESLAASSALVVTQACDVEADLVRIGVAERVARRFLRSDEQAQSALDRACDLALPFSIVRRAAHGASISMKRAGKQFRLRDLSTVSLGELESRGMAPADALDVVAEELSLREEKKEAVAALLTQVPSTFDTACMGKDALDALFDLLKREGEGDIRGWSCDYFHQAVRSELCLDDFQRWEVGKRLYAWEENQGHSLLTPN